MWMLKPSLLCNQHLLGEHYELHKLAGHIAKGRKLGKLALQQFVEPLAIWDRHDLLAKEMKKRNLNHNAYIKYSRDILLNLDNTEKNTKVDLKKSFSDLYKRCKKCRKRKEV